MGDIFIRAMRSVWRWIVDLLTDAGRSLVDGLVQGLPMFDGTSLEPFAEWLAIINQWVPLDAAIGCLVAYWTFLTLFILFKMGLKLFPGIG